MKKDSKMHDRKRKMRMKSLQELKDEMSEEMSEDFMPYKDSMKKVTVSSTDEEGLEEGLDKAQEILKKRKSMSDEEMDSDEDDEDMDYEKDKKYMNGGYKKKTKMDY